MSNNLWPRARLSLVLALYSASWTALAQLPVARLSHIFPAGAQVGSKIELAAAGSDLDEPARLRFSHPGIVGVALGDESKFSVTVASNVPPGTYEARFVGRFGMSNPRAFVVGSLPEVQGPATNTSPATAFVLATGTTVHGRAVANAVSWFRFPAKKGQRLFIECLAETIDSRMDATLVLAEVDGTELRRVRTGGFVDFTAPAEGEWLVGVADFLYRGGPEYFYRLSLSGAPRIDFVFPPAGLAGVRTNFTVFGRNLPGGKPTKLRASDGQPLEQVAVKIALPAGESAQRLDTGLPIRPGDGDLDGFEFRLPSAQGPSNPWLIGFASAPVVLENEPNNVASNAQRVAPPCEITGQFFPGGDVDTYTFDAKKGDVLWIEVTSARLGLPTDPFAVVQRASRDDAGAEKISDVLELADADTNLGDREFNTVSRDPAGRFEAQEAGTYRVVLRDLFGRNAASPRNVYRLALRKPAPDFRLVAMTVVPKYKADAKNIDLGVPVLRRGETIPVRVMAFRRDGFNGDIELALEDAPPGLIFEGDRIDSGKNTDFILLTAARNAPAFAGPVRLVGKARVGDRELVREIRGGTMMFPVGSTDNERPESRVAREFTVAIMDAEPAPVAITPVTNCVWEAPVGGKLQVPLVITRHGDFNAALKLKPLGPGTQESLKEFDADGKATNATLTLDFAALKLPAGSHIFAVQTTTTGKYRNNPEAAARAEAASKEAGKRVAETEAAAKKAIEELDKPAKAASEAATMAKAAMEKLAAARSAAEESPEDEKLKTALAEAETDFASAEAKAIAATEARVSAERAKTATETAAKEARAKKESAAARVKQLNDRAKPREVTMVVHSPPIRVRVTAAEQAKSK